MFGRKIGTTFLQHLPFSRNGVQKYLPLLPLAIEQLDLRAYDAIVSSSHTVAKAVLASPQQLHVCYCHSPMRFAWDMTFDYLRSSRMGRGLPGIATRYLLHHLRQWDAIAANRVDYFIANSHHTARRIWRCYRRPATVIYPPVDIDRFPVVKDKQDFYLTVSRLVSYKQVSTIVRAFNQLKKPLVVIGTGSELPEIRKLAQSHVQILGAQPNDVVEKYMAQAKAFVYAALEDFGIAIVEAQACGTPVIALGAGGALETVRDLHRYPDSATGIFFLEQTVDALVAAVEKFEANWVAFDSDRIRTQATQFTPKIFEEQFLAFLERSCQEFFVPSS
nr:glycosyltransferase [Chroococcidiopsis cubana]